MKYWLPVGLWMLLIFSASTDALSSSRTSRFIGPVLRWFIPDLSDEAVQRVQVTVRRAGHVTEYAVLTLLLWRALRRPRPDDRRPWCWSEAVLALLLATLYAASDELHQSFVPSRDGRAQDVWLDVAGAVAGLAAVWAVGRWRRRW